MASSLYVTAETRVPAARVRPTLTDLLLVCMALIWGVNFIVVKFGTRLFAPLAFNAIRLSLAVLVLWGIVWVRGCPLPGRRDIVRLLALGVLGNGVYQILFVEGIARTRASDAALLVAAAPVFMEAIGWLRGEPGMGWRGMFGIALSIGGIALVVRSGAAHGDPQVLGNALILTAALCWSLYSVLLKSFARRLDGLTLSALTMTSGLLPLLLVAAPSLLSTPWRAVDRRGAGAIAYSGVLALVLAYLFWYRGVRVLGPTRAAMYGNLQPLFAMTVAWAVLGEAPRAVQLLGAAGILGGLLLTRLPSTPRVSE